MAKKKEGSNYGSRGVDSYHVDKSMDSPWFAGNEDTHYGKLFKAAPRVEGMDGQRDGIRDGTSGANDMGGAGTMPSARKA